MIKIRPRKTHHSAASGTEKCPACIAAWICSSVKPISLRMRNKSPIVCISERHQKVKKTMTDLITFVFVFPYCHKHWILGHSLSHSCCPHILTFKWILLADRFLYCQIRTQEAKVTVYDGLKHLFFCVCVFFFKTMLIVFYSSYITAFYIFTVLILGLPSPIPIN